VQLADHPDVVLTQRPAPVSQDPQHHQLLVGDHRAQPRHAGGNQRDRVRIGGIGLAALAAGEHPRPGRQLGRHIHHTLAVSQQPAGDMPANALAALDRPDPLRPPLRLGQHRPVPGGVGAIPPTANNSLVASHHLDRGGSLMRIHPDHHCAHLALLLAATVVA
jgi:hypothetical protein